MKHTIKHIYPIPNAPEEEEEVEEVKYPTSAKSSKVVTSKHASSLIATNTIPTTTRNTGKMKRFGGWSSSPKVRVYHNGPKNEPVIEGALRNSRSTVMQTPPPPSSTTTTSTPAAESPQSAGTFFFDACTISVLESSKQLQFDGDDGMEIAANFMDNPREQSAKTEKEHAIEEQERDNNHRNDRIMGDDDHPRSNHSGNVQGYMKSVDDDDDDDAVLLIPVDAPNDMDEQESYVETIQKDVSTWNTDVEHHHHHSTTLLSLALPNTSKNQDRDDGAKEKRSFHETRSHESSRVHKKSSEPRTDNVTELPPTVDKSYNFMTTIHDLVDKIQREQAETAHLEQECLQMEREYHEILQTVTDYLESMKQKKEAMESKNAQLKQTLLGLQVARSQLLEQMPTTTPGAMCE